MSTEVLEALELVISRTKHVRYRELLAKDPISWGPVILKLAAELPHPGRPKPIPATGPVEVLYRRYGTRRFQLPNGCGVVCGSDENQFVTLQMMLASLLLSHEVRVTVVDYGLNEDQLGWLRRQPVEIVPFPDDVFPRDVDHWSAYVKPLAIELSPYVRTLWLDNDVLVEDDLNPLFRAIEDGPLLVEDHFTVDDAVMANKPGLYERFSIPHPPISNLCSGVVGLKRSRDKALLDDWSDLIRIAANDPSLRDQLAWWDQGALIWAASKHEVPVSDREDWNHAGRPLERLLMRWDGPESFFTYLGPPKATIVHFQGSPKPYSWTAPLDIELSNPPLSVFVLGHKPEVLAALPPRPFLKPWNLNETSLPNYYAEARAFLTLNESDLDGLPNYIGFASSQWTRKYGNRALKLEDLNRLGPSLKPDRVVCAELAPSRWAEWTDSQNRGLLKYIEPLREWYPPKRQGTWPTLWSHAFVAHRQVVKDFLRFFKEASDRLHCEFGEDLDFDPIDANRTWGYLLEAVGCVFWELRDDLELMDTLGRTDLGPHPPDPIPRDPSERPVLPHWVPPPEPALPNLLTQAKNFTTAAIAHVSSGMAQASAEIQSERWKICESCRNYRSTDKRCGGMTGCGCFLTTKITWASSHCPIDKWPM